jgi:hypothetical protein
MSTEKVRLKNSFLVGTAIVLTSVVGASPSANAAPLDIGGLRFSEVSGNFQITGGRLDPNGFVLEQEVYGPDVNLYLAINNFYSRCPYRDTGGCLFTFYSVLTNRTGTPWIFFDNELQEAYGVPSPEADGLSFAQGLPEVRPFTSNLLANANEITDVRDFVNFSGGVIDPGATVVFRYAIADTTPINRFFLLQRPNFAPQGVGFVDPNPQRPIPTPEPIAPPVEIPAPIVTPDPPVLGVNTPESPASAAVPEPSTILGVVIVGAIAAVRSRLKANH